MDEEFWQLLQGRVGAILAAYPKGIAEYRLIRLLRDEYQLLPRGDLAEPLVLFRVHFVLFHALYRLRERLWAQAEAHLVIDPLRIVLEPYRAGRDGLEARDALRAYYMDLRHLEETGAEEVAALLDDFWRGLAAGGRSDGALEVLGLSEPVDFPTIKRRYRELAMRHHPDRGGDTATLQRLNDAMDTLQRSHGARGRR